MRLRLEAGLPAQCGACGSSATPRCVLPTQLQQTRHRLQQHHQSQQAGRMRGSAVVVRSSRLPMDPNARSSPQDNPDFDDLVLDEALYRELGITEEELREHREVTAADVADPEGFDLGFDDISSLNEDVPMDLRLRLLDKDVFGPEAVVLAGFRMDEVAMTRAVLDSAGGHAIKVLPVNDEMLYGTVDDAVHVPETDWSEPRPEMWNRPCAWGAKKAVLFSGLSIKAQATVLELMEGTGLKGIAACMAIKPEAQRRLGDVLAEAVKEHRKVAPQPTLSEKEQLWKELQGRVADGKGPQGFGDLSQLLGDKARQRLQQMPDLEEGEAGEAGAFDGFSLDDLEGLGDADVLDLQGIFKGGAEFQVPPQDRAQAQGEGEGEQGQEDEQGASAAESNVLRSVLNSMPKGAVKEPPSPQPSASNGHGQVQDQQAALGAQQDRPSFSPPGAPEQDEDELFAMAEFHDILDSVLPEAKAASDAGLGAASAGAALGAAAAGAAAAAVASTTGQSQTQRPAATNGGSAANGAGAGGRKPGSVLSQIQSALAAGVPPDELKKLIDEAAAAMEAQQQQQQQGPTGDAGRASGSRDTGAAQTGPARRPPLPAAAAPPPPPKPVGPAPPPPRREDDPLLKLRPEARKALEGKNIKFVDLSKLPKKYRDQMAAQMHAKRQQQVEAQMEAAVQMAQRDVRQQGLQQQPGTQQQAEEDFDPEAELERLAEEIAAEGLAGGLDGAAQGLQGGAQAGAVPPGWRAPGLPGGEEEEDDMVDVEELERLAAALEAEESAVVLDGRQVLHLKDGAETAGLDANRALAEAVAMGVKLSPDAIAAVQASGMQLPSEELVAHIRSGYAEEAAREHERKLREVRQRQQAEVRRRMAGTSGSGPTGTTRASGGRQWGAGLAKKAAPRRPGAAAPSRESGADTASSSGTGSSSKAGETAGPGQAGAGQDAKGGQPEAAMQNGPRALTLSELRRIAERKNLDLQALLDDARSKGIEIADE